MNVGVAQLDRAFGYGPKGREFESSHARFPGCGSAWLERLVWDQEVAGSNPVTPICLRRIRLRQTLCEDVKQFLEEFIIFYAGVVQW